MNENNKPSDAYGDGVHDARMVLQVGHEEEIEKLKQDRAEAYAEGTRAAERYFRVELLKIRNIVENLIKATERA